MKTYATILATFLSFAPIHAMAQQAIQNPDNLVNDRGRQLEIYPALRASSVTASDGTKTRVVKSAEPSSRLSGNYLGVAFDHTLGVQAYLTGEITFKVKGGGLGTGLDAASYSGFRRLIAPDIYLVTATTPAELIDMHRRLLARSDLDWVEMAVNYNAKSSLPRQSPGGLVK